MTAIRPFSPGLYTSERQSQSLQKMRGEMNTLNQQLATGRRVETLGGLGSARTSVLDLRAQLAGIEGHSQAVTRGDVRVKLMTGALDHLQSLTRAAKTDALGASQVTTATAMNTAVLTARGRLEEALAQLNTDYDGQYLFSGRASDKKPVLDAGALLEGSPGKDGLRTLITERRQADLGDGLGRLSLGVAGAVVTLGEEAAGLPFGIKLNGIRSGLSNAAQAGPTGAPAAKTVTLTGAPSEGETIDFDLTLPDGSKETLRLTARTVLRPGTAEAAFAIDADPVVTAGNLKTALDTALRAAAREKLNAASAIVATRDLLEGSASVAPPRIAGPPFASATGFAAPGTRNTVIWFAGDDTTTDPRRSQTATIDRGLTVGVGSTANEAAIRNTIAGFAALAADQFSATDTSAQGRFRALSERISAELTPENGQRLQDISAELSISGASMGAANSRHLQRSALLEEAVANIEKPSLEELSAGILGLQTRLQASYQATASISRLSLADYL